MPDAKGRVISLLPRQESGQRYLWCRQCGLQSKMTLPVTMRPEQVECPGCLTEGFMVGQNGR